jgi:hypothetical protein
MMVNILIYYKIEIANSFEKNDHCYLKTLQYGAYLQGEKLLKKNLK